MLTPDDLAYLRRNVPSARMITPALFIRKQVYHRLSANATPVDCISARMQEEPLYQPLTGRQFSDMANRGQAWECMVTESYAVKFGLRLEDNPRLLIDDNYFKVVGIVQDPPRMTQHFQNRVVAPYNLAKTIWLPPGSVGSIVVAWNGPQDMERVFVETEMPDPKTGAELLHPNLFPVHAKTW